LVADGQLTDGLYAVIRKYQGIFANMKLVQLPQNVGLGKALNEGLKHCSYEWVARMDSDDISLPRRFEKQFEHVKSHPEIDVLGTALSEFVNNPTEITAIKKCPESVTSYIKFRSPLNHPTVIYKKSSVLSTGGYVHCPYMEDYHLWIRMYAAGYILTSLQESLYLFKMDSDTFQRRGGIQYVKSEYQVQKLLINNKVISLPRFFINVAVRCSARMIPTSLRAFLYMRLLRK
jgi:glycosyltransferase involved in cell wall biosynthesis